MINTIEVITFLRNKTKRVCYAFNPTLYKKFCCIIEKKGMTPTQRIEQMMLEELFGKINSKYRSNMF